MFENLTDLSFQRSRRQALGFYLAALAGGTVLIAGVVYLYLVFIGVAPLARGTSIEEGLQALQHINSNAIPLIVLVLSTVLSLLIIRAKKIHRNRRALACVVLAAGLSVIGAIFSFIPIAYLTTLPKGN